MNELLKLLFTGKPLCTEQMGKLLGYTREEIDSELEKFIDKKEFAEWTSLLKSSNHNSIVCGVIELQMNSECDGGIDGIARSISGFEQVDSCYLMGGTGHLLLFVKAESLYDIAEFVCEKLTGIKGVTSTKTRILLKPYKQDSLTTTKADEYRDPLTVKAIGVIYATRNISITQLQRKLRIGYCRSARIMNELEARDIIDPYKKAYTPRKIF